MERGSDGSLSYLKSISNILDEFKYESVLLVYHSKIDDNWVKAARVLDVNHKFKYMPAIRTYAISPEYCAMICKAFKTISPNRLMLNIVSGDIHEEETSIQDVVRYSEEIDTPEKRLIYTDKWMSKFIDLVGDSLPGIVMAGHSNETKKMAEKFNATHLSALNMYKESLNNSKFIVNKKQMVSVSIIVNESEQEIFSMLESNKGSEHWTLFGDKEKIKSEIFKLKEMGVTDLLISYHPSDKNVSSIHYLVKEMVENNNGVK
jgi:alkanesulfonate monooxygenase SsuD/methylene tetrahydromethanopterin reductase-like flavin-dependent oxidoreductase (luciferase family)